MQTVGLVDCGQSATTKPTLVDDKVMATLVTSNASALTGDSVTQIVKANPNVVDADTLTKLATNNPAAITSYIGTFGQHKCDSYFA